jgi:hypothetical protein
MKPHHDQFANHRRPDASHLYGGDHGFDEQDYYTGTVYNRPYIDTNAHELAESERLTGKAYPVNGATVAKFGKSRTLVNSAGEHPVPGKNWTK